MIRSTPDRSEPTLTRMLEKGDALGYVASYRPAGDGRIACDRHGVVFRAEELAVHRTKRFEGVTNPDDEQILVVGAHDHAGGPCLGSLVLTYGPMAAADDADILWKITTPPRG